MATTEMERPTREADQDRYRVSVEQYVTFRREGYLIVRGLLPPEDVAAFVRHTDDALAGREPVPGSHQVIKGWSLDEAERQFNRTSMPHRYHPLHERFLLHPRVLDVLEAIIGPDVMAMQSMLFLKPPGAPGQGYHQDSYGFLCCGRAQATSGTTAPRAIASGATLARMGSRLSLIDRHTDGCAQLAARLASPASVTGRTRMHIS